MITDYGHIHNQIMKLDPSIRLVTICTNDGQIMYSDHREGVKNLLTQDESKRSLELAVNAWKYVVNWVIKSEKESTYWQSTNE